MSNPKIDYALVHAHATDAGNESMRKGGRTVWSAEDFDAAVEVLNKYLPEYDPEEDTPCH